MKRLSVFIIILLVIILGLSTTYTIYFISNAKEDRPSVYVVMKSINPEVEFWSCIRDGAQIAGTELGVEVIALGSTEEKEVEEQILILRGLIEKRPSAIVLAANDYERMGDIAEDIYEAGITLVTVDSDVKSSYKHTYVGTNNIEGARQAADEMAKVLGGNGRVAIMTYFSGTSTAIDREKGFRDQISEHPGIDIIGETWTCNSDAQQAYTETLKMLEKYPDITGIFGSNETSILGVAKAVKDLGMAGKIKLIGFDSSEGIVTMIEEGVIDGVIVQRPFNMGYISVKMAVDEYYNDHQKKEYVDTGCVFVTKDNIYTPENQKLIFPFVK